MKFYKYLRTAQKLSFTANNEKQHIVVCAAFTRSGPILLTNGDKIHAEARAIRGLDNIQRIVVYRFNRADSTRGPRTSCPCLKCQGLILSTGIKKVEYMTSLGPVVVTPINIRSESTNWRYFK